jgi:hypothetical protein
MNGAGRWKEHTHEQMELVVRLVEPISAYTRV